MQKTLFPKVRPRRLRLNKTIRNLVSETSINKSKLIQPLFVSEILKNKEEIPTMPDQYLFSKNDLMSEVDELVSLGIHTIALFPNIDSDLKDNSGSEALKEDNFICRIVREIKQRFPELVIITDVALDPYTSTGHDGIILDDKVDNDLTVDALTKMSLNLASSGADVLAPSDMMDGRIGKIRDSLEKNNFKDTILLSYAAKYASNFYGPFRDAVGSKQTEGISKKTYQMDFKNLKEAHKEILLDINEGADILMVKPAMPYLDVINDLNQKFNVPIFAYQVSGEYSMLKMGIDKKILDHNVIPETLISLFRAGSSSIITYFARWTAENYDNIS
tara:strand:+ start:67 stop:1062 length:996 start_codon:yes stop_codon:yes gene_type:complete